MSRYTHETHMMEWHRTGNLLADVPAARVLASSFRCADPAYSASGRR